MAKKALIVKGGWDGHEPNEVAAIFAGVLAEEGFEVEVSDTLDSFNDAEALKALNLIVPVWTMGEIKGEQVSAVLAAVASGVGIAGCHGGMCDSFRNNTEWQFLTGTVSNYQKEIGSITRQIKDPVMAGFLLGKLSRAREAGIELLLTEDSYLPEPADPQVIHELITIAGNLLDNALETLGAEREQSMKRVELAFQYEEGRLLCEVSDNGPGIPPGLKDKIFIQGFSSKGEHRGIGLYLVTKSVDKLNGHIELASGCGTGAHFIVDVPYEVKEEGDL